MAVRCLDKRSGDQGLVGVRRMRIVWGNKPCLAVLDSSALHGAFIGTQVSNVGRFMAGNSCLPAFRWSASQHCFSETQYWRLHGQWTDGQYFAHFLGLPVVGLGSLAV
jgi:hypothetical protein